MTVHSDLILEEMLVYMQGMRYRELGKNTIFIEPLVPYLRRTAIGESVFLLKSIVSKNRLINFAVTLPRCNLEQIEF